MGYDRNVLFIGGAWADSKGDSQLEVVCPSTEKIVARVPHASREDVDAAITVARDAFDYGPWRWMSVAERVPYLLHMADYLDARGEQLAQTATLQNGTPISMTRVLQRRGTARSSATVLRWQQATALARNGLVSVPRRS